MTAIIRSVLIVEDDREQSATLEEYLSLTGEFEITTASTLREADDIITEHDGGFDGILLDLGMPDGDGRAYCAKLRKQGHKMPILILTGSAEEADIVDSLDAGANDYICKPYRINELVTRLRTHIRDFEQSDDATFTIGQYEFRPSVKVLHDGVRQRRLRLTEKEAAILKLLYRAGPKTVSRPVILEQVWGYNPRVTTHTLETHIYRLRQKLEQNPGDCRLLVTESGGYRLNATRSAP